MKFNGAMKTLVLTALALTAFAANSVLTRMALGDGLISAAGFTGVRLIAGAITLFLLVKLFSRKKPAHEQAAVSSGASWSAAMALFIYAATFSFAYISLDTATGALVLFGTVQLTILIVSAYQGEKLTIGEMVGAMTAFVGFANLVWPALSTPSLVGFVLMAVAGVAWGFYTLIGRGSQNPLSDTAQNFMRTLPFTGLLLLIYMADIKAEQKGIILAILSGAVASGVGYTIWYAALRGLTATLAGVSQLLVPFIAALGGILFVGEFISLRLFVSGMLILGGIAQVIIAKYYANKRA